LIEPRHSSAVIDKNYKPAVTRWSSYRGWCPHIWVYQHKWSISFIQANWIRNSVAFSLDTCIICKVGMLQPWKQRWK
jgi:hypothetical protein